MEKDYILRIIEQAGLVLRALFGRILSRSATPSEITQELRTVAGQGGLDLDLLRIADMDGVWQQVVWGGEADPSRTWLAAEILYTDGMAAELDERTDEATNYFLKAASLFRIMEPTWVLPTGFPEATERIEEIESRLLKLKQTS